MTTDEKIHYLTDVVLVRRRKMLVELLLDEQIPEAIKGWFVKRQVTLLNNAAKDIIKLENSNISHLLG